MLVLQQPERGQGARDDQELAAGCKPHTVRDALEVPPRDGRGERDILHGLESARRREERVDGAHDRRRQLGELVNDRWKEAVDGGIHCHAHGERARGAGLVFDARYEQSSRAAWQQLGGERDARRGERRVEQHRHCRIAGEQRGERARAVFEAAVAGVEHDEVDVTALECECQALVVLDAGRGDDGFIGTECGAQATEEEVGEEGDDDHESTR